MNVLLEVIIAIAALLAGIVSTPVAARRPSTGRAPRHAPSSHELARSSGGVVLYRRRYRH